MIGQLTPGTCPIADALGAWIEGRGDAAERAAIEHHIASCNRCADVVAAALPLDDGTVVTAAATPVATARPQRRRAARWAIAASLLVATAALAYGAIGMLAGRARTELARRAGIALGQPIVIGGIHLALARDLTSLELRLRDVRIGDTDLTTVDGLELTVPLASLAARAPAVSLLRVIGLVIHLGADNPGARGGIRAGGHHNAVAAAIGTTPLEIVESTLIVDTAGGPSLRFEHLAGTTAPTDGRLQVALDATIAGGTVHAQGELALADAGPISLTIAGRQLTVATLPYLQGRLSGTADLELTATGTLGAPMFGARALVRGGRAVGWNPLPQLAGNDLVFDELRIAADSGPHGWRVPQLYVTSAGLVAGASLEIGAARDLHGTGTVRLPATLAAALIDTAPTLAARRDDDQTLTLPLAIAGTLDAPRITSADEDTAPPPAP
jgi:hypothetical protein